MDGLTEGRMVHYVLSEWDAKAINEKLDNAIQRGDRDVVGNQAIAGQHVPAVVVRVWSGELGMVNLKCLLDGSTDYWATSRRFHYPAAPGDLFEPQTWHWIEKA